MKNYIPILIIILILGSYLIIKAWPENGWDGWGFGSAQTLLSNKHWVKDGFIKSYFLILPQGYSKTIQYFDDQELRHHTHGIATGGLIGKRLYYTHYPSGSYIPTALLMKLGVENRFWFRFLEILFSLSSILLLYLIFNRISNKIIALLGTLFYSISIPFLDYADSLTSQPIDEFLRISIIFLSVIFLKNRKNYFTYLIWVLYFALSISSYDSTFFIFAWLVGLDIIVQKKINWRKLLFWATAPILAFGFQILQNTIYLGWHDMLLDFFGAFKVQIMGSRNNFFISHLNRLTDPFDWFFGVKWYLGILISIIGLLIIKFIKKYVNENFDIRFLYLGFAAIVFNFLFYPSLFFYQSRIISIFGGLLIGSLTVLTTKALFQKGIRINMKILFSVIFISVLALWFVQANRTYTYIKNWPNNIWQAEKIEFDKKIKNLVSGDKVIFEIFGPSPEIPTDRYSMAKPQDEYYIGSPILVFNNIMDLIRDFNYLKKRSEFPFSTIIITDKKEIMGEIKEKLKTQEPISKIENKFILIIK